MNASVTYTPTTNPNIWEVTVTSSISALNDHFGYVYSDEASLFSLSIYPTEEAACDALNAYVNKGFYANSNLL